nr:EOG090X08OG [Macrothrix elegans]
MTSHSYNKHEEPFDSASYTAEISSKMHVPKRIRVLGGLEDEDSIHQSAYSPKYSNIPDPKLDMKVPDRILVVGQDKHIGVKAPPHELVLENSILSMDSYPTVRVRTPPRSITIDTLPSGIDQEQTEDDSENSDIEKDTQELVLIADKNNSSMISEPPQLTLTSSQLTEEVVVLRQQISRLHRRMAGLEREQQQRQQRDALMISIGAVYLVWKVILWLTRSV